MGDTTRSITERRQTSIYRNRSHLLEEGAIQDRYWYKIRDRFIGCIKEAGEGPLATKPN